MKFLVRSYKYKHKLRSRQNCKLPSGSDGKYQDISTWRLRTRVHPRLVSLLTLQPSGSCELLPKQWWTSSFPQLKKWTTKERRSWMEKPIHLYRPRFSTSSMHQQVLVDLGSFFSVRFSVSPESQSSVGPVYQLFVIRYPAECPTRGRSLNFQVSENEWVQSTCTSKQQQQFKFVGQSIQSGDSKSLSNRSQR